VNKYIFFTIVILLLLFFFFLWGIGRGLGYYAPIDHQAFGTYGDFIGGVIGTIFAAIAVFYAVKTYIKDKENAEQERIRQVQEQQDSNANKQKGKIENHFYTMLAKHNEYSYYLIGEEEDYFYKNIKFLKEVLESCENGLNIKKSKGKILTLSYLYFFYGSYLQSDIIPNKPNVINRMNQYFQNNNIQFEGVSKKLGVYFRQLYQIVTYINEKEILSYKEKYDYIKSLRATLSNEEQYLLFLNSLSSLGYVWELAHTDKNERLITKYNLIKNIPHNFSRILEDNDFEVSYPNILYEYQNDDEAQRQREEWVKDYR